MSKIIEFSQLMEHERTAVLEITSILDRSEFRDYKLLLGYFVPGERNRPTFETDALLVCKYGLVVLELKHWFGIMQLRNLSDRSIERRGFEGKTREPMSNPVNALRHQTFALASVLDRDKPRGSPPDPVGRTGIVLFTHPKSQLRIGPGREPWVVEGGTGVGRTEHFLEMLEQLGDFRDLRRTPLGTDAIERYTRKLGGTTRRRFPERIGEFILQRSFMPFEEEPEGDFAGYNLYEGVTYVTEESVLVKEMRLTDEQYLTNPEEGLKTLAHARRALSQLHHPNILTYHSHHFPSSEDVIYQAFQYDQDLEPLVRYTDSPVELKLQLLAQAADALAFVHEQGMLHRSINPYNILVADGKEAKLFNFDFARVQGEGTRVEAASQQYRRRYVADELQTAQRPEDVSWPCDSFSFGVTAFELLSGGEHPFVDPQRRSEQKDLSQFVDLSEDLLDLLDDSLSNRSERRPSMRELHAALAEELTRAATG